MIVLTGATGFVGSHILLELLKNNREVLALKRSHSDTSYTKRVFELHKAFHLFNKIRWADCHLSKYSDVVEILNGAQVVIHAAAQVNINETGNQGMIEKNVRITENIVNASILQHVKRFVYISSIATITNYVNGEGKENSPFEILTTDHPYTISKCLAELEVWRGIQEGLPAVIVNPSVILGYSRQWHVFESIIKRLESGWLYYPSGKGSFIDIRDVVKIVNHLAFCTSITNQRFILTAENLTYREFYQNLCEILDIHKELKRISKEKLVFLGYLGEIFSVVSKKKLINRYTAELLNKELSYSNRKIKDTLQYSFIPVKESLKTMVNYYRELHT